MPNLSALSRGTQLLAAAGVLLLIVTFFDWQSVDVGPISVGENAWSGFWGIIMGLALIVLLAWVIARIFEVNLPTEVPDGLITVGLGVLVFVFALLKNLIDDYSTIWSYIGVLLAAGVAFGAWLRYQETGGTVESLRASMPARKPASTAPTAPVTESTTPSTPAPETAPAEPAAPMPPPPTGTATATPAPPASSEPAPPAPSEPVPPASSESVPPASSEPAPDERRTPDAPPGPSQS